MDSTMYFCSGLDRWSNFILVEEVISTSWGSSGDWNGGVASGDLSVFFFCPRTWCFVASSVVAWPGRNDTTANSSATTETAVARESRAAILRMERFVRAEEGNNGVLISFISRLHSI